MPIAPMNCRCAVCISCDNALLEQLLTETPGVETPGVETPGVESPGVETPGVETPAVETPAVETPAVETPAVETPEVETPETVSCSVCDCEVNRDDAMTLESGDIACEDCAHYCDSCEGYFEETVSVRVSSRYRDNPESWCEDCREQHAFTCGDCGDNFHEDWQCGCNTSDEPVCESCAESYYTCESCSSTIHADDVRTNEDGESFCESCYGESENIIRCHSYKPCAVFHPSRAECDKSRAYGIELEVESKGDRLDDASRVQSLLGDFCYLKSDGSLHDGFEIVSHPATIAYHREAWREFFVKRPRTLRSHSTTTCGLHIHASRKGMTSLQIAKIVCFVNSPANRELVELIARRGENNYCKKYDKKLASAHRDPDATRYQAVNLEPYKTIEFRIFKGTLSYIQFLQALEFVDALIAFCAPASRSIDDSLRADSFEAYVAKNKKQWPELAKLLGHDSDKTNDSTNEEN